MLKTESMNGVMKITRRSVKQIQIREDKAISIDVIAVSDRWYEISSSHRVLEGDKLIVQSAKFNEYAQARLDFVQGVISDAYTAQHVGVEVPILDRAEAEEFLKCVTEATDELRNFIFGTKDETSSLPTSTVEGREINFSQ